MCLCFQEDASDDEPAIGSPRNDSPPVTAQPSPKKGPNAPVYAMPPPTSNLGESAALNQGDVPVYTPGTLLHVFFSMLFEVDG